MNRITRVFRILSTLVFILALGANWHPAVARPVGLAQTLPYGGDELWMRNFSLGPNDWIYATAVAPNGDVYVGGDLSTVEGVQTGRVARWSASDGHWHALGKGITWGRVYSLAISGNYLYVGGYFDAASDQDIAVNGIARWNMVTNTWSNVGGVGMAQTTGSPDVYALTVDGSGNVYAGGDFSSVNGLPALNIAKWNGSSWSAMGSLGALYDKVYALVWHGSTLVAGGNFIGLKHIAAWNGSGWATLGNGADDDVLALASDSSFLYVGGSFNNVVNPNSTNVPANYVAMWNWSSSYWLAMGNGFDGPDVDALVVGPDNKVYAGGRFHNSGSVTTSNLARWSGSWESISSNVSLAQGVDGNVYSLAFYGEDLWIAGGFQSTGNLSANNVIKYGINPGDLQWRTPGGNAPNGPIYAVLVDYPNVYFGGAFTYVDTMQTSGVVRYNMSTHSWSTLERIEGCASFLCGGPVVHALAISGTNLYVGGDFTTIGGTTVHGLARVDLSSGYSYDIGSGVSCSGLFCSAVVDSLKVSGSTLIVGGAFQKAGAVTVNNIAKWTIAGWQALQDTTSLVTGTNAAVFAIDVNPTTNDIIIGGSFSSPAASIAKWNGSHWSTVGSGTLNGAVNALDYLGASLYVGGNFTNAGGSGANYLARTTGSNWLTVGGSVDAPVRALADNGAELLVGGDFSTAGVLAAHHIVRWTGARWDLLGSGVSGVSGFSRSPSVYAIAALDSYVYLGGNMRTAGPFISDNIAIWGGYLSYLPLVDR